MAYIRVMVGTVSDVSSFSVSHGMYNNISIHSGSVVGQFECGIVLVALDVIQLLHI
jgi:hypothetical protein